MRLNPLTGQLEQGGSSGSSTPVPDFRWAPPDTWQLWINGALRQSWTTTPVAPAAGSYLGFGAFTYS